MPTVGDAHALAAKGYRVFPLVHKSKKPVLRGWQKTATTDPAKLSALWARAETVSPGPDIGILCVGLFVIDIDGVDGEQSLAKIKQSHHLPDTVRIDSGNTAPGHYQLVYRLPDGLNPLNRIKPLPGIDIKTGANALVVAPGSTHKTGGVYRWADEAVSFASEAALLSPTALAAFYTEKPQEEQREKQEVEPPAEPWSDPELHHHYFMTIVKRWRVSGSGQRHTKLGRAVAWLVGKGLPIQDVLLFAKRWTHYFAGVFESPLPEALADSDQIVTSTFAGQKIVRMQDHVALAVSNRLPSLWWYRFFPLASSSSPGGVGGEKRVNGPNGFGVGTVGPSPVSSSVLSSLSSLSSSSPRGGQKRVDGRNGFGGGTVGPSPVSSSVLPSLSSLSSSSPRGGQKRVDGRNGFGGEERERFLRVLLILSWYQVEQRGDGINAIKMTTRQMQAVWETLYKKKLSRDKLFAMIRQFVKTKHGPAQTMHLLTQVHSSRCYGKPSIYAASESFAEAINQVLWTTEDEHG